MSPSDEYDLIARAYLTVTVHLDLFPVHRIIRAAPCCARFNKISTKKNRIHLSVGLFAKRSGPTN